MSQAPISVLIISDDPDHSMRVRQVLARAEDGATKDCAFRFHSMARIEDALERLKGQGADVVFLYHALRDNPGRAALDLLRNAVPFALVLLGSAEREDETTIHYVVQSGPHDAFGNAPLDIRRLPDALRFVIKRNASQTSLQNSEARFWAISDASPLGIFVADTDGGCVYANAAYQEISGLMFEQALGTGLRTAIHPQDLERVLADWHAAARGGEPFRAEFRLLRPNDSIGWTRVNSAPMCGCHGQISGAVIVFRDIGPTLAMAQKKTHLAHHDFLTGLPNRVLLIERTSQAITQANRHGKRLALLFIDLDIFKRIIDLLGHAAGDRLLRLVAKRLAACVRAMDTLCRQGGNEFVMLLTEIEQPQDAARVVEKLHAALTVP